MGYKTYTCPIAKSCGGCEWLAVPYPIQLKRKQAQVEELLAEMVAQDGGTIEPIRGMEEPLAYRYKAATPFAPGKKGHIRSGFYAAGTHRIVRCESCLVEPERAREALNAVARIAESLGIAAYNEDSGRGMLRHAVIRLGYASDEALLTLVTNGDQIKREQQLVKELREACPWITSIVQNMNDRRTNAILGWRNRTLFGPGIMHDQLLGCSFEIGPTSFYQTNPAQTEVLYQLAIEGAQLQDGAHLLDAYCGTGTIGICAAHTAAQEGTNVQVTGIERVKDAIAAAERNARANGLADSCSFIAADATAWLTSAARHERTTAFDAVILDPPRAGIHPDVAKVILDAAPQRIVYVSCNPASQARDLAILCADYEIVSVQPVDMFPHTMHVENVVALERKS